MKKKKRLLLLAVLLLFWTVQNCCIVVTKERVTSGKINNNIKIVQITDLHSHALSLNIGVLIRKINRLDADLVVATGDMAANGSKAGRENVIKLFRGLSAPVYFVPGEHDDSRDFLDQLEESGVNVLEDESARIEVRDTELDLYGIDNLSFSPDFDLQSKFGDRDAGIFTILLAHIPAFDRFLPWGPDLTLSGDTHGGVVRLPLLGPLYHQGNWLPRLLGGGEVYDKGMFRLKGGWYFVSSGAGNYPAPLRLFNRPEICLIELVPGG